MIDCAASERRQPAPAYAAPHGFEVSAEEHALLRATPPAPALEWATAAFGSRARIESTRAMLGGTSSAVHELLVRDQSARLHRVVLRRHVRTAWLAQEPDLAEREARTLELLQTTALPAPRLLAIDPDGSTAGAPAVLMTRLPGEIEWNPTDVTAYLDGLVELLVSVHAAIPCADTTTIPRYTPYALEMLRPPVWANDARVWLRAIDMHLGPAPAHSRVFIHRDFHPGNVLWHNGRVTGIIDWVNASVGAREADVGHCRLNLAQRFGMTVADAFLRQYQERTGTTAYHPYWDVVAALGGLDETWDANPNPIVERFLAVAVSQL